MADPSSPTGVESPPEVLVVAGNEQDEVTIDVDRWAELATGTLRAEGHTGELTLTFVDRAEIAMLNTEHMGIAGPTDVLSFPLDALDDDEPPSGPTLLGDVVICPSIAAVAASTHAGTIDDELALLTVHGVLHVLGYDHADAVEQETMRSREVELLVALHWHGPPPNDFMQDQGES